MEKTVKRDDICVGRLAKHDKRVVRLVIGTDGEETMIVDNYWKRCRTILFTIDEEGKAHDLLYDTEPYPIDKITPGDDYKTTQKVSVVFDPIPLKLLLEYFRYPEDINIKDIKEIRERFFTPEFFKNNCHLFGYRELEAMDLMKKSGFDTSDEIARVIYEKQYEQLRKKGFEQYEFIAEEDPELPFEYFNSLRTLSGILSERYCDIGPKDVFKPKLLQEGYVKRLVKTKR